MQVIPLGECNVIDMVEALKQGATLAYPTETCYGLGCDATNEEAVEKIYEIKGRTKEKSFILLADSLEMMRPYIAITPQLEVIAEKYWPGPVTVIVPALMGDNSSPSRGKSDQLAPGVIATDGTIAFRVTSHSVARKIVQALGRPLVSTSANLAGQAPLYCFADVVAAFQGRAEEPDLAIDGGDLPVRPPSTVVRLDQGKIAVLRQGGVIVDDI